MSFFQEEIEEFRTEASELLDQAETSLLNIENGDAFSLNYDAIFRAFHSVKGASGMMEMAELQSLMHNLENHFQSLKPIGKMTRAQASYFLKGLDVSRKLLYGESVQFELTFPGESHESSSPNPKANPSPTPPAPVAVTPTPTPVKQKEPLAQTQPTLNPSFENKKSSSLNPLIYVVDDEQDIIDILTEILEAQHYTVKSFTKAKNALTELKQNKPQVILSDMKMPQMSGLDFLKELNKFEPDIPLIFISGYLDKETIIDAISHGVFGAIEKPFNENQVITMTNNALKRYQLWRLLNKSIDFLMFQFSNVDNLLKDSGKEDIRQIMKNELNQILLLKRELRKNNVRTEKT